jgi:HD-GYP domain-containing protein (c-di-GMP phosphodiesterase class II)
MTVRLANELGIADDQLIHFRRGALLHDIGKIGIPDYVLHKPGALSEEEWSIVRKHPGFALNLLSPIPYLRPALDIPYCHHEKWDGTGYPRGLQGDQIPIAARIFAVIDIWDALRYDRPYRRRWDRQQILEHIESLSGSHLDPRVVDIFLQLIHKEEQYF